MTQPPWQRPPRQPNGQARTKLAVGEQVPPKVPTQGVDNQVKSSQGVDVDVSQCSHIKLLTRAMMRNFNDKTLSHF